MTVALLIPGLGPGGAETQVVRLARGLVALGWKVEVLTLISGGVLAADLAAAGIPVISLRMRGKRDAPAAFARLVQRLRGSQPDILVGFMFHADLLCRLAGPLAGVPVVVGSVRSIDMGGRHRELLLRMTDGLVSALAANAEATVEHLKERNVSRPEKIWTIPNGIETDLYGVAAESRAVARRQLGLTGAEFVWLCIGRFERPKDHANLLAAFATVLASRSDARLWMAGTGPLLEEMVLRANQLGIAAATSFLGFRSDVPRLLAAADAVVQASAWEGLPNAVMEGLAAERPVVATRVGGTAEMVRENASGFLVPPRDSRSLAGSMLRLMELSDARRAEMGAAGREEIQARFESRQVVTSWARLFEDLLAATESR